MTFVLRDTHTSTHTHSHTLTHTLTHTHTSRSDLASTYTHSPLRNRITGAWVHYGKG